MPQAACLKENELWYKDAVIYELHVKAFFDSNGDGIGDFKGLTSKLEYIRNFGVTAVWLLPFYPSPLKDDGYDIANYFNIHPDYGTLKDFKEFLTQAHQMGIRVITELVLNHTSRDHIWFQRSRRAKKGSVLRNFYVWSDTPDKYKDARVIFKDFEASNWAWDPVAKAYYWHRFYSHQPDLNFENPYLQKTMLRVIDYWFNLGVDGMRLDAVPYLFEREGTNCENLPETHAFLKKLRAHVDSKFKNKMLLAEANQWPEDAAVYFGLGDECHMAFHFPLMPRMFMAIQMEDGFPIADILRVTPAISEMNQWALFLRNHDELTLEMVTDEERDYMYRAFAQDPRAKINLGIRRRLAPLLGNNRRKIDLLNILLFSLPGTPVLYYGDELGMGDNYYLGDRNGVRTPMQWSPDRNAGFSKVNPQQLYLPVVVEPEYHYEALNVENQERNLSSPLCWMKRVIAMRKKYKAFSRGDIEMLSSNNPKVLVFARRYQEEIIIVAANLSRFSQAVAIEMPQYAGRMPFEVFSENKFPVIDKTPYLLTLGPHSHYWLKLKKEESLQNVLLGQEISFECSQEEWKFPLKDASKHILESVLPEYVKVCRWFGSKSRIIRSCKIIDDAVYLSGTAQFHILLLEFSYNDGAPEIYCVPLGLRPKNEAAGLLDKFPKAVVAAIRVGSGQEGVLFDGMYDEELRYGLLAGIAQRKKIKGTRGFFACAPTRLFKKSPEDIGEIKMSQVSQAEQSNTSVVFNRKSILKLYRRLDQGINPEAEILGAFSHSECAVGVPPLLGAIEYFSPAKEPVTVALLQGFIENTSDAWTYAFDNARSYYEYVLSNKKEQPSAIAAPVLFLSSDMPLIPEFIKNAMGAMFLEMVGLLGRRTAELHLVLASFMDKEEFTAEPFSLLYQKSVYKSMQGLVNKTMQLLGKNLPRIRDEWRDDAKSILSREQLILDILKKITRNKIFASKIRIHGDYHLGQVLFTGKDFVIIDFEGEPARPLSERRLKRSPLRDVAGLMRSFHYAAYGVIFLQSSWSKEDIVSLEPWVTPWYGYASEVFLSSYLAAAREADFLPKDKDDLNMLLQSFLLEKAVYELAYELNHRPDWVIIPIRGIQQILLKTS
ncbi:MAG: maltose alpha-D-glucosyltransferase [Candidatus Omnitrophota bacterium]